MLTDFCHRLPSSLTICLFSYPEFRKGLRDYGVDLDEAAIKALFAHFDRDKSGSLDFDEFLEELRVRVVVDCV